MVWNLEFAVDAKLRRSVACFTYSHGLAFADPQIAATTRGALIERRWAGNVHCTSTSMRAGDLFNPLMKNPNRERAANDDCTLQLDVFMQTHKSLGTERHFMSECSLVVER